MLNFKVMTNNSSREEIGIITDIEGMMAKVNIPRKSACEGCTIGICKPGNQTMEIEAINAIHARVGQKVKIVMKPYTYLKGTIIVYGIPAIALVIGAIFGKEVLSNYFRKTDPDIISMIFGLISFVITLLFIKLWSLRIDKKTNLKPVIEEVIE